MAPLPVAEAIDIQVMADEAAHLGLATWAKQGLLAPLGASLDPAMRGKGGFLFQASPVQEPRVAHKPIRLAEAGVCKGWMLDMPPTGRPGPDQTGQHRVIAVSLTTVKIGFHVATPLPATPSSLMCLTADAAPQVAA